MNPEEMLFELKPCDECSHSCVEGQFGVKCPYDLIVEPLLNKTKMKTQKEIEELAKEEYGDYLHNPFFTAAPMGYVKGYAQCQEDVKKKMYEFGKLVLETFHSEGRTHDGKDRLAKVKFDEWFNNLK
jgi:hypothetical protein